MISIRFGLILASFDSSSAFEHLPANGDDRAQLNVDETLPRFESVDNPPLERKDVEKK